MRRVYGQRSPSVPRLLVGASQAPVLHENDDQQQGGLSGIQQHSHGCGAFEAKAEPEDEQPLDQRRDGYRRCCGRGLRPHHTLN